MNDSDIVERSVQISELIDVLDRVLRKHPYLRFGQIVCIISNYINKTNDSFYILDEDFIKELKRILDDGFKRIV